MARNGIVDLQDRTLVTPQSSTKRSVRRGTYFTPKRPDQSENDGWNPLPEEMAETIEHAYVNGLWNVPIKTIDNRYFFIIKTDLDIRRYENPTTDESDFVPVLRGFSQSLFFFFTPSLVWVFF